MSGKLGYTTSSYILLAIVEFVFDYSVIISLKEGFLALLLDFELLIYFIIGRVYYC